MPDIPGDTGTRKKLTPGKGKAGAVGFDGDEDWFKVDLKRKLPLRNAQAGWLMAR